MATPPIALFSAAITTPMVFKRPEARVLATLSCRYLILTAAWRTRSKLSAHIRSGCESAREAFASDTRETIPELVGARREKEIACKSALRDAICVALVSGIHRLPRRTCIWPARLRPLRTKFALSAPPAAKNNHSRRISAWNVSNDRRFLGLLCVQCQTASVTRSSLPLAMPPSRAASVLA